MAGQVLKLAWMQLNRKPGSMTNRADRGHACLLLLHSTSLAEQLRRGLTPDLCLGAAEPESDVLDACSRGERKLAAGTCTSRKSCMLSLTSSSVMCACSSSQAVGSIHSSACPRMDPDLVERLLNALCRHNDSGSGSSARTFIFAESDQNRSQKCAPALPELPLEQGLVKSKSRLQKQKDA